MLPHPPEPDVLALRASRQAILMWLVEAAMTLVRSLRDRLEAAGGASLGAVCAEYVRLSRWVRVAIFVANRVGQGDLDQPPAPPSPRSVSHAHRAARPERDTPRLGGAEREDFDRYLRMPFGELVARLCRGLRIAPDWDAWATEPWARAEAAWPPAPPPPRPRRSRTTHGLPSPLRGRVGDGGVGAAAGRAGPRRLKPYDTTAPPGPAPLNRKARRAREALARATRRHA